MHQHPTSSSGVHDVMYKLVALTVAQAQLYPFEQLRNTANITCWG